MGTGKEKWTTTKPRLRIGKQWYSGMKIASNVNHNQKCDSHHYLSETPGSLLPRTLYLVETTMTHAPKALCRWMVGLSDNELFLLEYLTAVENGSYREVDVPTDGLIAQGYIVPIDGRVCLTVAGVAKVWGLRERQCANRIVRQNSLLEPGLVSRVVHSLWSAGRIV